jgi:PAS domain S-box-containing protein
MERAAPAPVQDPARLKALRDACLLDTPAEESFDRLTRLASTILHAPVALVSLVDEDRQFFKSCVGLPEPWASRRETPLSHSFCQHVEEREHLLQALEVERERLNAVFEQAPAFLATLRGPEHIFEMANPSYYRLVGHRDIIGKSVREALPEIEGQGYFELLDEVYTSGKPFVGNEAQVLLQRELDGPLEELFVNFVYQPLVQPDGSVSGIFAYGVDVTEQVRARQEVEELSRAKSDFLAVMSHELRTPLTAILGYAELLLMGVPEPISTAAKSQVDRIDAAARHLLQLIEEILTFSRVDAGKEEVQLDPVELSGLAQEAASFIQPLAEKKGLALDIRLPEEPMTTVTDRGKVRQILINLLSNAVKFTPAGEVRLEVVPREDEALIQVRDTGIGIAPEHLGKVFEPFWQVQQSPTREMGGTGLGLSVSYKIAQLLGGDLRVESVPGQGSTFTLVLPLQSGA